MAIPSFTMRQLLKQAFISVTHVAGIPHGAIYFWPAQRYSYS